MMERRWSCGFPGGEKPSSSGHHDVHDDQVKGLRAAQIDCLHTVACLGDRVSLELGVLAG